MKSFEPAPVKLFVAALFSDQGRLQQALKLCEEHFGPIDFQSVQYPFEVTDYYDAEMGRPIYRQFFSFASLANPGQLADFKVQTNAIEATLAIFAQRQVNLDIGYLDYHKVVLASTKFGGQKIFLGRGIYADPALYYSKGTFHPTAWTFPDFKDPQRYPKALLAIRLLYKRQRKGQITS